MHIATVEPLEGALLPAIRTLRDTLDAKAKAFSRLVMTGRTHLQDATPLTLGRAISGWVAQLDDAREAIRGTLPGVLALAIGGAAGGYGSKRPSSLRRAYSSQNRGGNRKGVHFRAE
jgi:fumarate hydratase, class II